MGALPREEKGVRFRRKEFRTPIDTVFAARQRYRSPMRGRDNNRKLRSPSFGVNERVS